MDSIKVGEWGIWGVEGWGRSGGLRAGVVGHGAVRKRFSVIKALF